MASFYSSNGSIFYGFSLGFGLTPIGTMVGIGWVSSGVQNIGLSVIFGFGREDGLGWCRDLLNGTRFQVYTDYTESYVTIKSVESKYQYKCLTAPIGFP